MTEPEFGSLFAADVLANYMRPFNYTIFFALFFAFISISCIQCFTAVSMKEFRYAMLNITVTALMGDVWLTVFVRPYPMNPVFAGCTFGLLNEPLRQWVSELTVVKMNIFGSVSLSSAVAASTSNAAIQRFLALRVGRDQHQRERKWALIYMATQQVAWPLFSASLCATIEQYPVDGVAYYSAKYPDIVSQSYGHFCLIATFADFWAKPSLFLGICSFIFHLVFSALVALTCGALTFYGIHKHRHRMSPQTMQLRLQLLFAVTLQTFLPVIFFCAVVTIYLLDSHSDTRHVGLARGLIASMSLHSVGNCIAICASVPMYRRGIGRMLNRGWRRALRRPPPLSRVKSFYSTVVT